MSRELLTWVPEEILIDADIEEAENELNSIYDKYWVKTSEEITNLEDLNRAATLELLLEDI